MSTKDFKVTVEKREELGTDASRRLRRQKLVPAVVYGSHMDSVSLTLSDAVAMKLIHHTGLVFLKIKKQREEITAILKEIERHPITGDILHIDLLAVKADQVVTSSVAIEPRGEAAGVHKGGQLEQSLHLLEIRCLPKDMIEILSVDVSTMELDSSLHVKDLQLPEGISTTVDPGLPVFQVRLPKMEEAKEEVQVPEEEDAGGEKAKAETDADSKGEAQRKG